MKLAVYPGTFDPITNGHLEVVKRAAKLADRLVVAVAASAGKQPRFKLEDRVLMCQESFQSIANVTVESFHGLLIDFLKSKEATLVFRGIRTAADMDYEFQLAAMNQTMYPECETVFLRVPDTTSMISSTIVREIAAMGGDVSMFVPAAVQQRLNAR